MLVSGQKVLLHMCDAMLLLGKSEERGHIKRSKQLIKLGIHPIMRNASIPLSCRPEKRYIFDYIRRGKSMCKMVMGFLHTSWNILNFILENSMD